MFGGRAGRSTARLKKWQRVSAVLAVAIVALVLLATQLPMLAAGGLLHPRRHVLARETPNGCIDASFAGVGVTLEGWRCAARGVPRATVVYLHGIADNRGSAAAAIEHFQTRGFDVVAYDSRAHGASGGDSCTYGFFEKQDLHAVIDTLPSPPVVLIGASLGAAVALQETPDDPRVAVVVAAEVFSDLRTIARERAPFFLPESVIRRGFALAEREGHFTVDAVSPLQAAARITVPVLLVHGALDTDTVPAHSQRVFAAIRAPKRLVLVPRAHHNESLNGAIWPEIDAWIEDALRR